MKKILLFAAVAVLAVSTSLAQVSFETGKLHIRVDDYGAIRLFTTSPTDTVRHFDRLSILVGGNTNQVMDYYQDLDIETPNTLNTGGPVADYDITGTYNNLFSSMPPNILVKQSVYGWMGSEFIIVKAEVTNKESAPLEIKYGLDLVPRIDGTYDNEYIFYDGQNKMITAYENTWVGVKALSSDLANVNIFIWYSTYTDVDADYYSWLTAGGMPSDSLFTDADGGVVIAGFPPLTLNTDETVTYYFAVAAAPDKATLIADMDSAVQKYSTITSLRDEKILPAEFSLKQNYPNPFNPSTSISFTLPSKENVYLKIYNSLGEEVAELLNNELDAGTYTFNYNASGLSSGIYFYTINAGSFVQTKKMMLIK